MPELPETTTYQIRRLRRTPTVFDDGKRIFHQRLQVEMQPGIGNAAAPTPTVLVRFSDTNGKTWSNTRELSPGSVGQFRRIMRLFGLGSAYNRTYEIVVSDPVAWAMMQAFAELEPGTH